MDQPSPNTSRPLLIGVAAIIGAACLLMLVTYGTVSPCGALKVELRGAVLRYAAAQGAQPTTSTWGRNAGIALGTMMVGSLIDNAVAGLGPLECTRALIDAKMHPDTFVMSLPR